MSALPSLLDSVADASGQQPVYSPRPFEPGDSFADRYVIERQLGTGGMASVWLAYDRSLERPCALKILDADKAMTDGARNRFHREARVAARIRSASVVNIFDHGEHGGLFYIAMEYLEGEDLASRIAREGRLDARQTSDMIAQIARGLTHAHTSGVIHRDIKPENIFLVRTDEGEISKILDFGIATQVLSTVVEDSQTGLFLGTPMYASPEQVRGLDVDWRTDLWSLGVVAFECLTGRVPFTGETLEELCGQILSHAPPTFGAYDPNLPDALEPWLLRVLSRDPEQRYQSAKELAEAFADAVGYARLSIPSLPPHSERFSDPGPISVTVPPISGPMLMLPAKRSFRKRWFGPVVALVLLVGAGAGYQRGRADGASHGQSRSSSDESSVRADGDARGPSDPLVTVAAALPAPESNSEACQVRATAPKAAAAPKPAEPAEPEEEPREPEADSQPQSAPRKGRAPLAGKASSPPAPGAKLEAWRRDPGF